MRDRHGTKQRVHFLLLYTILFALTGMVVFRYFPAEGRRMVWKGDGLSQHYVALCYYARWGKAVLKSLLAGQAAFPTFNMHMGFGADLFTTLQYYVIGDPFSLPAVFVPQQHMRLFHDAMIILRIYLAGICFDSYCRQMGHRDTAANLCGALIYVFSSFVLFGMRHPYFLNAMILFPLLLIGAEHIFLGRKGRLFTAAVFLSCISNFYFFYMLVFMTVLYVVWRALRICLFPVPEKGGWKQILLLAGKFLLRAGLGTAMGAVFLLPILLRFTQDPRASEGVAYSMLYPPAYYKGLPESFVGFGAEAVLENWTCLGVGGIGLLGVLLLFVGPGKKSGEDTGHRAWHPDLKIAFIGMTIMTLLPAAGAALNGFTYPANRWIWAFCMLSAYITAVTLPSLRDISPARMALVMLFLSACTVVCALLDARKAVLLELILAAAAAAAVRALEQVRSKSPGRGEKGLLRGSTVSVLCGAVLTGTVVLTAVIHGHICFARGVRFSGIPEYHTDRYIDGMMASDAAGMRSLLGNDTFYRYSGRYISNNFALLNDVSDTQYYWSLSDSRIEQFFTETGQSNGMVHLFDNLDNRTMLDEIAGVTYYKRGDGSLLPFGYEKLEGMHYDNRELFEEKEGDPLPVFSFSVYKNLYGLPLGFTADHYVTRQTYDALTIPQRQEALMQGILLEDEGVETVSGQAAEDGGSGGSEQAPQPAQLSFTQETVPFTARAEEGIGIVQNSDGSLNLTVSDTEAALHLDAQSAEMLAQAEVSVLLEGVEYTAPEHDLQADKPQENEPHYANTDPVIIRVTALRNKETVSDKEVQYTLPDNPWKTGRSSFLSCCGYTEEPLSDLYMKFSRKGSYTFRNLQVIRQPMEEYPSQAGAFGEYVLEELDLHELPGSGATDRITGTLTVPDRRILCIQIPRCDGLKAFVDGAEVPLLQADTMFCAAAVDAGTHQIELRYRTPGLAAGAGISLAALLIVIAEAAAGLFLEKKRNK